MKSYLIKDTTKEERIELIRQWVPADEAMEDCEIDLWDMYRDYINGVHEIAEINAAFVEGEQCGYDKNGILLPRQYFLELKKVCNGVNEGLRFFRV